MTVDPHDGHVVGDDHGTLSGRAVTTHVGTDFPAPRRDVACATVRA